MNSASDVNSGERRLTAATENHLLTNVGVWSHDSQWIYYDVRSDLDGAVFDGKHIKRVDTRTGKSEVVFEAAAGSHVGVVTANPVRDELVFIHGPETLSPETVSPETVSPETVSPETLSDKTPTGDWQYSACHRRGVVVSPADQIGRNLDARDLVPPFTPGALRGGSHVHVFSGDGNWVSFTYEDHVLSDAAGKQASQANQRNVGVASPVRSVDVPETHPRNHKGSHFSVIVTRTCDHPVPGSDEIDRAYSDAWIGSGGYKRTDGTQQIRALAFIGDCVGPSGMKLPELFIVEVPDDVTISGNQPLAGTPITRPCPPEGTVQRRLTYTADRNFPGLASSTVRHWPRSSPDGTKIAFLMKDELGRNQLWTIAPTGEALHQLTHGDQSVESAFTFRCDGRAIACVIGGRICEVDVADGKITALTPRPDTPEHSPISDKAVVYSPDGKQVAFTRIVTDTGISRNQIHLVKSRYCP